MTTIKKYTDILQSKKLIEILPIESADMYYSDVPVRELVDKNDTSNNTQVVFKSQIFPIENLCNHKIGEGDIYAWSLAALLSVLPDEITDGGDVYRNMVFRLKGKYIIQYPRLTTLWPSLLSVEDVNLIDACVEMIIKLHELKML